MIHEDWRAIYWLSTALVGVVTLLVVLSFPETHYKRQNVLLEASEKSEKPASDGVAQEDSIEEVRVTAIPPKKTYVQELKVFSTTYTSESLLLLMYRPLVALALPAVLWATLKFHHDRLDGGVVGGFLDLVFECIWVSTLAKRLDVHCRHYRGPGRDFMRRLLDRLGSQHIHR